MFLNKMQSLFAGASGPMYFHNPGAASSCCLKPGRLFAAMLYRRTCLPRAIQSGTECFLSCFRLGKYQALLHPLMLVLYFLMIACLALLPAKNQATRMLQ